ncbi:hypothetical protein O3P69_006925 [Scylla paramamosain]|uniref:Uncharacterized protein n=1 Tax=Scylla paramamosain TaxID=85552 RepID=A0AAW0U2F1_SCYPA
MPRRPGMSDAPPVSCDAGAGQDKGSVPGEVSVSSSGISVAGWLAFSSSARLDSRKVSVAAVGWWVVEEKDERWLSPTLSSSKESIQSTAHKESPLINYRNDSPLALPASPFPVMRQNCDIRLTSAASVLQGVWN